jgi:hypothetical protein
MKKQDPDLGGTAEVALTGRVVVKMLCASILLGITVL